MQPNQRLTKLEKRERFSSSKYVQKIITKPWIRAFARTTLGQPNSPVSLGQPIHAMRTQSTFSAKAYACFMACVRLTLHFIDSEVFFRFSFIRFRSLVVDDFRRFRFHWWRSTFVFMWCDKESAAYADNAARPSQ